MDHGDCIVESVLSLLIDLVDVDGVIVRSHGQILLVRRVGKDLTPLSWFVESSDSLVEVIVVEDQDVSVVVAHGDVVVLLRVGDGSTLLVNRVGGHGRSG